ncbi:UPF0687 protein C20orf27 homolog isoform X2 [Nannospalax galili]|uniref:UPF0687 protein C20orf27 homolog isoform X2 n=1 Tax=Nannospalax galili TaxID=1026970 RepID=UPI00111C7496|nr:UPF0687 protein C20orf27 homolog isoform X2 [Nannospalax galili]
MQTEDQETGWRPRGLFKGRDHIPSERKPALSRPNPLPTIYVGRTDPVCSGPLLQHFMLFSLPHPWKQGLLSLSLEHGGLLSLSGCVNQVLCLAQWQGGCPWLQPIKVGFLKILHRYEITFTLPPVHRLSKDIREAPVHSLHLKLLSVIPVPEGYSIKCEYSAHKEGVLKEEMLLACEGDTGTCVHVMVQARVMDRHHGTPMLLDGVKCVGAELEYDSEHSDWHGFD